MNLISEPWIPVTWSAGKQGLVSLNELFSRAKDIQDLDTRPHERIALMRLIICITQAALDGPEDYGEWEDCREEISGRVQSYLRKWQAAFELFGKGQRFLQVSELKAMKGDGEGTVATKLDLALATGNNATVFDNAGGSCRPQEPARLGLSLLTFQCFSPGGRIGVAKWNGKETPGKGSSTHAPCVAASMLHCFLLRSNLLETIHQNLLSREQVLDIYGPAGWGRPLWEAPVRTLADKEQIKNATTTYLGRLVPLSRAIELFEDGTQIVLANGLEYPIYPVYREPTTTLVERKEGIGVLSASLERGLWRQLPAITVRRRAQKTSQSGPLALANLSGEESATLWLGAVVTDKAKIEDIIEGTYRVPAGMFKDSGRQVFEHGVEHAEDWERALGWAVKTHAEALKLQPVPYDRARRCFWTAVEQHVPLLLALTEKPSLASDFSTTDWGRAVRLAATEAYEAACSHQTPRQVEAFAKGRQQLFLRRNAEPSAKKEATKVSKHKKDSAS